MFGMGKPRKPAAGPAPARSARKPAAVAVTVTMEPRLRDKFALLGGEDWLREQLERARSPAVPRD